MNLPPTLLRNSCSLALLGFLLSFFVIFQFPLAFAESSATPALRYTSENNTLFLGNPASTQAANEVITLPALASALAGQGLGALLVDQGSGSWLLKANLIIERSARLEATAATMAWLRLDSPPLAPVTVTARRGGHLLVDGITVTSWDSTINAVDTSIANGRSYLLALEGARMDILHSDVGYLGALSGEPSGLSWRKRLKADDPTTGATGRLEDSKIHHNYFGMYSYEAYGIKILRNEVYDNLSYGIDPHDYSQQFEVAYNRVYNNGTHGIIFSRLCTNNTIHHNEVFNNAQHGIMLDRGSNQNTISDNLIYNNQDGIAIFQSSDNIIRNNTIRQNLRGIRINATYDADDVYDGISANNQIIDNVIEDSTEQGVYLYARADRNRFQGNQILRSGLQGFYIKSGGNRLENNLIHNGGVGITIVGGEYQSDPPVALPALDPSGNNNVVISTTVSANSDVGIRILGGSNNQVGPTVAGERGNRIVNNGKDGIAIGDATNGAVATDNQVLGNTIQGNTRHGVLVTDLTSVRNRISLNSITGNGQLGIKVDHNAQQGLQPPAITTVSAQYIRGTALANTRIEVYSDPGDSGQRVLFQTSATLGDDPVQAAATSQLLTAYSLTDYEGALFLGNTSADGDGIWDFTLPAGQNPDQVSVLAIDAQGNTSAFSGGAKGVNNATFQITLDGNQQKTIEVGGIGSIVSLGDVKSSLGGADVNLLEDLGNGTWQLNANLLLGIGVRLDLSPDTGVQVLRLRSQASAGGQVNAAALDYSSFVYLRSYNGEINIDNVQIFSWDAVANDVDRDPANGRAYITAKYDSVMNIHNADIGYLGSADGESYGLTWRDTNEDIIGAPLRARVTGEVIDSLIHHNYYGIYTYQASDMLFRGNQFYENVRYGFDPHDFSHSFLVENNAAYNNGTHGFIISRGCNNFVIRNNVSYNNLDPSDTSLAHGFMLDPGSPNSADPQAPSNDNLLENNEAYGNEGYGLRILGSNDNTIRANYFHANAVGISVEQNSTGNLLVGNRLNLNERGVYLQQLTSKSTVRGNEIMNNNDYGIYVRSAHENLIENNVISNNANAGIGLAKNNTPPGFEAPRDNQLISNTVTSNLRNGINLENAQGTLVKNNRIAQNKGDGVYLKDSTILTAVEENQIAENTGYGIELNGIGTTNNSWTRNAIYGNSLGGIGVSAGAVLLPSPQLLSVAGNTVTGTGAPSTPIEIFSDAGAQGQYYLGSTTTSADGSFSFTVTTWPSATVTAIQGYGSSFSVPLRIDSSLPITPTATPIAPAPDAKVYLPIVEK